MFQWMRISLLPFLLNMALV
ncbi:hypothetical protein Godav_004243, partial [Gossypium davidsonii]|nr:hypothetical protein [Gossypium davidsonii]MBA0662213.1 hypothetical protein [Gossypium klotzschianum]